MAAQFIETALHTWPIHIIGTKNLIVINSGFYMDGAAIQLHMRAMYNSTISGNTFDSESLHHVAYHGYNYNNNLSNNEFTVSYPGTQYCAAVDIGIVHASQSEKFTVYNNNFTATSFNTNKWGIGSVLTASTFEDINIKNNNFTGFGSAIHLNHLNSGNTIEKNTFSDCSLGLDFWQSNPGVDIRCNTFDDNDIDILIRTGGTLQNQIPGYDPNNSFSVVSPFNYNIVNQGSTDFFYHYQTSPPVTYVGTGQNVFFDLSWVYLEL